MKSFILAAILLTLGMSFAYADNGAEGDQTSSDGIRIIREWK